MNIIDRFLNWLSGRPNRRRRTRRTSSNQFAGKYSTSLSDTELEAISRIPMHLPLDKAKIDPILRTNLGEAIWPEFSTERPPSGYIVDELKESYMVWEMLGELDSLKLPNGQWLPQYQALIDMIEIVKSGEYPHEYIHYLYCIFNHYPGIGACSAIRYTKRILSAINNITGNPALENGWSKLEIANWYKSLPMKHKAQLSDKIANGRARGYSNDQIFEFMCRERVKIDQLMHEEEQRIAAAERQAEQQAEQQAMQMQQTAEPQPGLLSWFYAWQEQGRKMEEHEYFKRENRKAAENRYKF